ncbi:restriction endonuclease [Nocardia blacklockiae]|uniref:restriction endonuclease n=1 Tax=Nocardia blacklockiae TaxID=480036 RepID=UPI001894AE2B|nr:restriction endonuclease [Nocardia blacklockiae]MBF6176806.1 restriction endonuclease [Nocardia blacklockiae]
MVELSCVTVAAHLRRAADPTNSTYQRGQAYEDALEHIFQAVPGCDTQRNSLNRFASEEVDISVLNFRDDDGLRALPEIFLVECKNWSEPVNSAAVNTFATKIRHRGCTLGVLVAANGVTGDPHEQTAAFQSAALALSDRIRIILITTEDLMTLTSSKDVVVLLHRRLLDLVAAGTFTLA